MYSITSPLDTTPWISTGWDILSLALSLLMWLWNQLICTKTFLWLGGIAVGRWTCDQLVAGSNPGLSAVECNPGQVVNTRASVTKQYNLVPANKRWCLAAGKVTIGLASHWPCVTDVSGSSAPKGLEEGDEHPPMLFCGVLLIFIY